jgi:hypothetical protein
MKRLLQMPFAIFVGIVFGLLFSLLMPVLGGSFLSAYDGVFPVLRMSGTIVSKDGDSVVLHISGVKLRGEECRLVSVYGYTVDDKSMRYTDAIVQRVDMAQTGRVRDKGLYDIGLWSVRPVGSDTKRVQVYTHHECLGRAVLSIIADVSL